MSPRTIYLSRLIGLYCILVVLSLVIHRQASVDLVTTLLRSPSMTFVTCIMGVVAGLAIILAHNVWSGGAQVVVVTLVGWLALIKSLIFLLMPSGPVVECILKGMGHPPVLYLCLTPSLLIGIYLTWAGFTSKSHS